MKIGDKIRTPEGGIETITEIKGDLICTEESVKTGTWYSTSDLLMVYYSETFKRFVPIPDGNDNA